MRQIKRDINLKWKPYIISFIVCFLLSLVGLILSTATWDTPRRKKDALANFLSGLDDPSNWTDPFPPNETDPGASGGGQGSAGPQTTEIPPTSSPTPSSSSPPSPSSAPPPPPPPPPPPQPGLHPWLNDCLVSHNNYRRRLRRRNGSPVPDFVWSNKLLGDALSWAKYLAQQQNGLKHSTKFPNGENLYSSTGQNVPCKNAVDAFFNEWPLYKDDKIGAGDFHNYGHYTQVNYK